MSRSDPQVVERIRASQDELWKTSPQDASLNEDALPVFDEEQQVRQVEEVARAGNSIEKSTASESEEQDAVAFINLQYSSDPKAYVEDKFTGNKTLKLSTYQLKSAWEPHSPDLKKLDAVSETEAPTTFSPHTARPTPHIPHAISHSPATPSLRHSKCKAVEDKKLGTTPPPPKRAKATEPKKPVKRSRRRVVAPLAAPAPPAPPAPAGLALKAPRNTPGIPNNALTLNEFFQKDTPCALGVQLPVDRARTRWEWADYVTRKSGNAHFDWSNDQHLRDANRWRQQRIRRRFTEHGVSRDGRKHA